MNDPTLTEGLAKFTSERFGLLCVDWEAAFADGGECNAEAASCPASLGNCRIHCQCSCSTTTRTSSPTSPPSMIQHRRLVRFANASRLEDAGLAAAQQVYGKSLGLLPWSLLGPGDWAPKPDTWVDPE